MLDSEALVEIQSLLIEDATFSAGLWTLPQVLTYFNQRQYRFLAETQLVAALATLPWVPGQPEGNLPPDYVDTILARWHDFASGAWIPLAQSDSFELDHLSHDTALTVFTPQAYRDSDEETLRLVLGPVPISDGEVELVYVALSEALTGLGVAFEVPDDFAPYVVYGVLADMLGADCRGQDLLRARYCETRFEEGIALAQALLDGWD
jgi:hypothetical protein